MRPNERPRRRVLPTVALAVGAVLVGAVPTTAATSQTAASGSHDRCVRLNLIDRITSYYANMKVSPIDVPVGFMTVWFGQVQSATDATVTAGAVGNLDIIAKQPTTGVTTAYLTELIQFSDGAFRYAGPYNRTDAIAQQWITTAVTGISGRYLGRSGTVHWRILSLTDAGIPVQENVVMCSR